MITDNGYPLTSYGVKKTRNSLNSSGWDDNMIAIASKLSDLLSPALVYTKKGEMKKSFEEILDKYQNMVYSTAFRLLFNKEEAEDITQEVFLKVYDNLYLLELGERFSGWLKKVTINLCLNYIERHKKRYLNFSQVKEDGDVEVKIDGEDIFESLEVKEGQYQIEKALAALPEGYRIPIVLCYLEEKSYAEIGELLKTPLSSVKINIFRGKEKLKEILRREGYFNE